MNGIAPDKSAALLLCYDTPTSEVAAKGMKSITSNYMLPPVEVDQLSRSSGEPEDLNPRFGGQRETPHSTTIMIGRERAEFQIRI